MFVTNLNAALGTARRPRLGNRCVRPPLRDEQREALPAFEARTLNRILRMARTNC